MTRLVFTRKPLIGPGLSILALSALLAACEERGAGNVANIASGRHEPNAGPHLGVHAARGRVTAIAGRQITIAHEPVSSLGWPAATRAFTIGVAEARTDVAAGDWVVFEFMDSVDGYTIVDLRNDS